MLVELDPPLGEQLLESLLRARPLVQDTANQPAPAALVLLMVVGSRHDASAGTLTIDADGSTLSRRVWSDPSALGDFADPTASPAVTRVGRVKEDGSVTDIPRMDAQGARLLAARIRAGVSVGARIELVETPQGDSGLFAGDRGVVDQIDEHGRVVVTWDRGFASEIDPGSTPILTLAA